MSCYPLNPDKMAELLLQVIREQRGYQEISIRKSSPLAEKFCRYLKEVFGIPESEAHFPEDLKQILRQKLQGWGYPLEPLTRPCR